MLSVAAEQAQEPRYTDSSGTCELKVEAAMCDRELDDIVQAALFKGTYCG